MSLFCFILEWISLAEYIKSERHVLGLKYQSVQGYVITLSNTGVLVLTADTPLPNPWAVCHKQGRLISWMNVCLKDGCYDFSGWHSTQSEINKYLPCSTARRPKSRSNGGKFSQHLSSVLTLALWWEAKEHEDPVFSKFILLYGPIKSSVLQNCGCIINLLFIVVV